jgi:hypothetical protein
MAGWGVGDDLHEGKDRAQSQAFANFKIKLTLRMKSQITTDRQNEIKMKVGII